MTKAPQLPDDIDTLKALLVEKNSHIDQLEIRNVLLQEQLNLAIARRYAASSEKISLNQFRLFDEAEADTLALSNEEEITTVVAAHTRTKKPDVKPYLQV